MKNLFLLAAALLLCSPIFADDFPYGNFLLEEMNMRSYDKDKTANAVVLNEYGKTWISSRDGLPLIHEYHIKIKIFNSKAFDKGNIEIPIYKSDNRSFEEVKDIEGVTFYTDEQGSVKRAYLDPKKAIIVNQDKNWNIVKFAMPNLRDGCVIEYKYTLESPYTLEFRNWTFQSDIPKMYSEYEARIPAYFEFKASLRGFYKLTTNSATVEHACFDARGQSTDCSKLVYGIKDLPAFKEEDYMTAPSNFISAVKFELNQWVNPFTMVKTVKTQTWNDIDRYLKQNEDFGTQIKKTGLIKDQIAKLTTGLTDDLSKAKAIYAYMQKNLKVNNYRGIWSYNGARKTLDTHTGNVGDINMALITALNSANINTDAVLLSTRDHGFINMLYPVVSDFDYVVAKVNIGDKSYMLDATDPLLPFGLLPQQCINGQGRVIIVTSSKPSYWIDMVATQKKTRTYLFDLTLMTDGKLKGTIRNFTAGYDAVEKRRTIKKFNSVDEYVEDMDEKEPKMKILKSTITNLDSLDLPLSETYEVEFDLYKNMENNRLAFNPYLFNRITSNPFKLDERVYPVDMGAATDAKIILTLRLPEGYTIETPPQNEALALPNQGGRFLTAYEPLNGGFTFSHIIQLNRPIYSSEEYPYLKELFNKIIQAQKADIVFVKK